MFSATELTPILNTAIERLREAGLEVRKLARADAGYDAVLEITTPAGTETYAVRTPLRVSPGLAATTPPSNDSRPLIVTEYIPEPVAESLRRQDVHYVDTAGNAYLRSQGFLLDIRGRPRPNRPRPGDRGRPLRAFRAKGLEVLFVLLADPDAIAGNYRNITRASAASLGTVHWVVKELEEAGYVAADGDRKLHRSRDLLSRWVEAYTLDLYPRLTLATFDAQDPMWWKTADEAMRANDAQWGGETAVHRTYKRLRPGRAIVYANTVPTRLATEYRFRKAPESGNVEVRQRFWTLASDRTDIVVPSPLIYADLVASGDPRQLEAAAHLREHDALLRRLDNG